ncbi:MAG: RNA-binding S4 domain-containing protein [Succinivibrionaceae bacterium]
MDIRLDKWLWAARFYKTRTLARNMIQGGKVHYNNKRVKPSKTVEIGAHIELWQGFNKIEVIVKDITENRQKYEIAKNLYQETESSIKKKELLKNNLQLNNKLLVHNIQKPNKKQRREILKLKNNDIIFN